MSNQGYFWYSQKQREAIDRIRRDLTRNYCRLDNGKIVEYTNWTQDKQHGTRWDDIKLLGHGYYHRSDIKK